MRRTIIINDPIYTVMSFGSDDDRRVLLKAVVDSREFQRLRRISQLGLASYVFPGATHTRFSHSLGTAFTAYKILNQLLELGEEKADLERYSKEVLVSALLHDVGHGPFSHSFEEVLKSFKEIKNPPEHEAWTYKLITSEKSSISKVLTDLGIDPAVVASPFQNALGIDSKDKSYPPFLKEIVSSQLDADRMDYLERDSHFAGVSLGRIDTNYLIDCITIIEQGGVKNLGITKKGIKAYESFVLARHLMNQSIYYHPKIKVLETMVEQLLSLTIRSIDQLLDIPNLKPLIPDYLVAVGTMLKAPKDYDRAAFMEANLEAYVRLTEDKVWALVEALTTSGLKDFSDIAIRLLTRNLWSYMELQRGKEKIAEAALALEGLKVGSDFLVLPLESTLYKQSKEKVFVSVGKKICEITLLSRVIESFRDQAEGKSILIALNADAWTTMERVSQKADFKNG